MYVVFNISTPILKYAILINVYDYVPVLSLFTNTIKNSCINWNKTEIK